jgi:hypothetical protein
MAGLVGAAGLADLTPVAAEAGAGAAEGDPRPVYTWMSPSEGGGLVGSYLPSDGGAPRLVSVVGFGQSLCVWDTGTGALLQALQGPDPGRVCRSLATYQRPSDGRPRVAAGFDGGHLWIWDGDDFQLLRTARIKSNGYYSAPRLAVYEELRSGRTRLVSG